MKTRHAFTLVEILTVVAIIGILAAIVTVAVAAAMGAAKRAQIATTMSHAAMGLERYKAEIGEYPPDFYDDEALIRHVRKRWPRFELPQGTAQDVAPQLRLAMSYVYHNVDVYPPELTKEWYGRIPMATDVGLNNYAADISALTIWLGGFPNREGRFEGFSADPEAPFGRDINGRINRGNDGSGLDTNSVQIGTPDKKVFMELEVNKNVFFFNFERGGTALAPCLGTKSGSTILPIVYFRGNAGGGAGAYYATKNPPSHPPGPVKLYNFGTNVSATGAAPGNVWSDCGVVVPYAKSGTYNANLPVSTIVWNNATTYQLIHPGLDGKFGVGTDVRVIGSGDNVGLLDLDNLTNFSDYRELKSILP